MPQGSSLCVRSLRAKDPHFRFGLELGSVRRLAHHSRMAEAELKATVDKIMDIDGVRGGAPISQFVLTGEFTLGGAR